MLPDHSAPRKTEFPQSTTLFSSGLANFLLEIFFREQILRSIIPDCSEKNLPVHTANRKSEYEQAQKIIFSFCISLPSQREEFAGTAGEKAPFHFQGSGFFLSFMIPASTILWNQDRSRLSVNGISRNNALSYILAGW